MPPAKGRKKKKPQSSPFPSTRGRGGGSVGREDEEEEATRLQNLLSTAAAKFPKFFTKDAYIARVSEVDVSSQYDRMATKICVANDAMTSSPLRSGDLVTVSFAGEFHGDMPLEAFSDVLSQRGGDGVEISKSHGPGNYFAIAMLYPDSN